MLLVLAGVLLVPVPAAAQETSSVAELRRQVAAARAAAEDAAARWEAANVALYDTEAELARVETALVDGEAEASVLRAVVRERAVRAYMGRSVPFAGLLDATEAIDVARRTELIRLANAEGNDALEALSVLDDELARQRRDLQARREQQRDLLTRLDAERDRIASELRAAEEAQEALEARLAAERAERERREQAARAAAERAAAVAAARAAQQADAPPPPTAAPTTAAPRAEAPAPVPAPSPSPSPGGNGLVCPIQGPLSFIDSWGAPRSGGRRHQGVDLMSPTGTANVAVVSGTITHKVGGLAGNSVYLHGDDGNVYYYFHLSAWEGGPRRVAQGEVVGYTGDTGNARGTPHTHFEVHPGGGAAVNPYPWVRPVC